MLLLSTYTALQLILVSIGLEIELSINSIPFTTNEVDPFVKKSPTKNISSSFGIIDERAIVFSGLIYILEIAL